MSWLHMMINVKRFLAFSLPALVFGILAPPLPLTPLPRSLEEEPDPQSETRIGPVLTQPQVR